MQFYALLAMAALAVAAPSGEVKSTRDMNTMGS